MRILATIALLGLAGCFGKPLPASAYGISGTTYTAPDLCGALVKCKQAESACYIDVTTQVQSNGTVVETSGCKEVSGKR